MEQVHIAICDDENIEIEYFSRICEKWSNKAGCSLKLSAYESAESFLFHYEKKGTIDILLLDIQMKEMDGIQLARKIREEDDTIQIVFITGIPDYIGEGYEVEALHYLLKPVVEEKLIQVLDRAVAKREKRERFLTFQRNGNTIRIAAGDIRYAEVQSHHITLYLTEGEEIFYKKLSEMEEELGEGFFKCHRSYLVSMACVCRITRTALILETGEEIPLSRRLYDEANQAFIQFHQGLMQPF